MHTLKNRLIAAACGAVVIAAILLLVPHRSEAQYATPVRVTNTTAQSIPVVPGPGGTPFSYPDSFIITTVLLGANGHFFTVNATHALVIDQISWDGDVSTGQRFLATITCTTGGKQVSYRFQVPSFGADFRSPNQDRIIGTVPLHVYCDANTLVFVQGLRSSQTNAGGDDYSQNYVLSGYLLP